MSYKIFIEVESRQRLADEDKENVANQILETLQDNEVMSVSVKRNFRLLPEIEDALCTTSEGGEK